MEMPGRTGMMNRYRFGFNGKENDREWGTAGLTQDYGMRLYNPAVGRFLSVDPISLNYPMLTPYQFASNSPIGAIDIDGLEGGVATTPRSINRSARNMRNSRNGNFPAVAPPAPVLPEVPRTIDPLKRSLPPYEPMTQIQFNESAYGSPYNPRVVLVPPSYAEYLTEYNKTYFQRVEAQVQSDFGVLGPLNAILDYNSNLELARRSMSSINTMRTAQSRQDFLEDDSADENEYLYRAMSLEEFNTTGGAIVKKRSGKRWIGDFSFVTEELDYLVGEGGLVFRPEQKGKYQIIIRYTVKKGTIAKFSANSDDFTDTNPNKAAKEGRVAYKQERIYSNWGFHGTVANDLFHPNIEAIKKIKIKDL